MRIKPKQYAISLFESLEGKDEKEAKRVISQFAKVLAANNQVSDLKKIIRYFNQIWNREYKIVEAEIIAAHPISAQVQKELEEYICKKSKAEKVEMTTKEDKNLLGGVIIKYDDKIIDGSIRTRLLKLKDKLTS